VPNFVSFAACIGELAHGEKSPTESLNHPAYFTPRELKRLRFGKIPNIDHGQLYGEAGATPFNPEVWPPR